MAAAARVSSGKLIDWMMKFQFQGDVDYFELNLLPLPKRSARAV